MANYLVTGGGGFIGGHLAQHLVEAGESVRVLDNFCTGSLDNLKAVEGKIDLITGDMRDPDIAKAAMDGIDYVLHQAALPSVPRSVAEPRETSSINVMGTVNLLDAARQAKIKRFVYAASSSAYGNQDVPVKIETLATSPLSPYAAAKLTGELFCQSFYHSYGLETVCLRYFNVFGPRQNPDSPYSAVIPRFVTAALNGKQPEIYGDGNQTRDFTFVHNNVRANILAATSPNGAGEMFNIACGDAISLLDLLGSIGEILGLEIQPQFKPSRSGDVMHSRASIEKARDILGYRVEVDYAEGLRRTVEHYRQLQSS